MEKIKYLYNEGLKLVKKKPYISIIAAFVLFFIIPMIFLCIYFYIKHLEIQALSQELSEVCTKLKDAQEDLEDILGEIDLLKKKLEVTFYDFEVLKEALYKTAQDLRIARNDLFRAIYDKVK